MEPPADLLNRLFRIDVVASDRVRSAGWLSAVHGRRPAPVIPVTRNQSCPYNPSSKPAAAAPQGTTTDLSFRSLITCRSPGKGPAFEIPAVRTHEFL